MYIGESENLVTCQNCGVVFNWRHCIPFKRPDITVCPLCKTEFELPRRK